MNVKLHYDNHLGNFYSWMTGDFQSRCEEFAGFLATHNISPSTTRVAIDLGAGHGIQTVPLLAQGFKVIAVDFNQQLLDELGANTKGKEISIFNDDIRNIMRFKKHEPELVVCCGDTLSHLHTHKEVEGLFADVAAVLPQVGKFVLSFRDYTREAHGSNRVVPVKSEESRILTCFLEYDKETVTVTDILHENNRGKWNMKASTYRKLRLRPDEILPLLEKNGLRVCFEETIHGMVHVIALRK